MLLRLTARYCERKLHISDTKTALVPAFGQKRFN